MTRYLVAAAVLVAAVGAARAGGPPPVYVVPEAVTVSPADDKQPERVTIRGAFIRQKDGRGAYGPAVAGVVCLGLDPQKADACRAEWKEWAKAAGTGRSVAIGSCGAGGALLKVTIHKPDDAATAPDATYTPGFLGRTDRQEYGDEEAVQRLLKFAKERKAARVVASREP